MASNQIHATPAETKAAAGKHTDIHHQVQVKMTVADLEKLMPGLRAISDYANHYKEYEHRSPLHMYITEEGKEHDIHFNDELQKFTDVIGAFVVKLGSAQMFKVQDLRQFRKDVEEAFPDNAYIKNNASNILIDICKYQYEDNFKGKKGFNPLKVVEQGASGGGPRREKLEKPRTSTPPP